MKKISALVLAFVLSISFSLPAQAANMSSFPTQTTSNYSSRYTRAIQVMLMNYRESTRSIIQKAGGIDAVYGSGTASAVKKFQEIQDIDIDGKCGPTTWRRFNVTLIYTGTVSDYKVYKGAYPYTTTCMKQKNATNGNGTWYCRVGSDWNTVG